MVQITQQTKKGFTLIELMVSISIFAIVMTMSMGAILSVLDANQKSQTVRSVVDNLNATLESMTRSIRFGTNYHCGSTGTITAPQDCISGDTTFSVLDSNNNETTYSLSNSQIMRSVNGATALALTSPDVVIQSMTFYVFGTTPFSQGDLNQPRVIILVKGQVNGKTTTMSTFTLQTTISQRALDSN